MKGTMQPGRTQMELVRQTLKLAPVGVVATLVNAVILVLILWQSISHTKLLIWFSITFCLAVQRYLFISKYSRVALGPRETMLVARTFVVILGLSGMVWGSLAVFLFPLDSPTHQTLIVFVLCGMVAGAAETFAPLLPAFIAFVLTTLIPLFIRFISIGKPVYYGMGAMTLLYIVLTLVIAKRINNTNRALFELKEHYARMVEERTASNALLEKRTAELNTSNRALKEHTEKLERLNEELQDFVFVASHDLQEPLRKLQTYCDLTNNKFASTLDSAGQEYLQRIMSMASRMRQQLSDLLQYSLAVSMPGEFKAIDLAKIAREASGIFEDTIKEIGGLIEIETMPVIEADEVQILRLFQNLIGNALKFRSEAPPRIMIYAKQDEHGMCEIFVKDNGIGFDRQFAERIFRPFQRLHGRKIYEGTGIGLTICRKIVERHGGCISAESEFGKGSTFIVRLPVKQALLQESA